MNNNFTTREQVLEVANTLPYFDSDFVEDSSEVSDRVVEDDGFLHVNLAGVHLAFNVGQEASRSELNRVGRQVARAFGLTFNPSR